MPKNSTRSFSDKQVLKTSGHNNNCALNVIVTRLANDLLLGNINENHLENPAFKAILEAYKTYYTAPDFTWDALIAEIRQYEARPFSLQIRLGPVLRMALAQSMLSNMQYMEGFELIFQSTVNRFLNGQALNEPSDALLMHCAADEFNKIEAEFKAQDDTAEYSWYESVYHFMFGNPNELPLSLEVKVDTFLDKNKKSLEYSKNNAFQNYVNYLCNPENTYMLGIEHAKILAHNLGYQVQLFRGINKEQWEAAPEELNVEEIGTIKIYNKDDIHYEGIADNAAIAEVHNQNFNKETPDAYALALELSGGQERVLFENHKQQLAEINNQDTSLSDWLSKDGKIQKQFIMANKIMNAALDGHLDVRTLQLKSTDELWAALEKNIQYNQTDNLMALSAYAQECQNNPVSHKRKRTKSISSGNTQKERKKRKKKDNRKSKP